MFRRTYEFKVANEKWRSVLAIMDVLEIRKFSFSKLDNLYIYVTFKANKKELNKVMSAINKYGIGVAELV